MCEKHAMTLQRIQDILKEFEGDVLKGYIH